MNNAPLGIFDSGVGGLTVARAIIDRLPHEQLLYIGDTANTPYGTKPLATVRQLALEVMDGLVDRGVKLLVIACNTASAAVLHDARERYQERARISVVEVIQPAARRAAIATKNGKIGVLGTEATVRSGAYFDALAAVPGVELRMQACTRFVEFAEAGLTTGPEVLAVAQEYLAPLKEWGADTIVMGCTHYPLLAGVISYVMGPNVALVSSADQTANDVYRSLMGSGDFRDPSAPAPVHEFITTGPADTFMDLAARIVGPTLVEPSLQRSINNSNGAK